MSLVERWNHVESGLEPGWTEATLSLEIVDSEARSRAAALLGPAGPGFSGGTIRFTVSTRGQGIGPDGVRRLLRRIDGEGVPGRLELVTSAIATVTEPAVERRTLSEAWSAALAVLPGDWSDLVVELELESSADVDRGAVLCAPLNPIQLTGKPGFRLRCANRHGYGASAGMVGRCLGRLDDDGISGRVRITRVLCDVHPVGTQGAVFSIGRRPS
ncbi:MAG TPA: hypothetical protein VMU72_04840 [Gaiellaceae bacterium]|nr:hypothetical protein [Gaiellaceae bacterium]